MSGEKGEMIKVTIISRDKVINTNSDRIVIDGEEIKFDPNKITGAKNVFKSEVETGSFRGDRTIKIGKERFNARVVNYLRNTAQGRRVLDNQEGDALYKAMALQYHPDFYITESQEVKETASEMFKTLRAMHDNGEFE